MKRSIDWLATINDALLKRDDDELRKIFYFVLSENKELSYSEWENYIIGYACIPDEVILKAEKAFENGLGEKLLQVGLIEKNELQ